MADDDKSVLLQVAEAIQEAATHWDGDYQETIDLPDALEAAEKIIGLIGWPFSCDRCGLALDRPGALAFSDPLPHIASAKVLAVKKHHLCADCYGTIEGMDFVPTMSGYEIEEALRAGHLVEMWFSGSSSWVTIDPLPEGLPSMACDEARYWPMEMLKAGHRGVTFVARVVGPK